MKRRISLLLFSVSLLSLLLFVPSASGISETILIFQVKTEGSTASEEYIVLHNRSESAIDIVGWCIRYSSLNDNPGFEICVDVQSSKSVGSGQFVTFGTQAFVDSTNFSVDFIFTGGMAATGGHLRLINDSDQEIDRIGWGTAINPEWPAGQTPILKPAQHLKNEALSRDLDFPDTDNNFADFSSRSPVYPCPNTGILVSDEEYVDEFGLCVERFCPNLPDSTTTAPEGYYKPEGETICLPLPKENRIIFITELFPNPPGNDNGQEFVELYNPNSEPIDITGYRLQVGPSFTKEYTFAGEQIEPGHYAVFKDIETGIVLPNSKGVSLRLIAPAGNTVSESMVYENAEDDVSWALLDDIWIFTNQITPSQANKPYLQPAIEDAEGVTTIFAPCPAGKYRNPDTNRCRNIETAVSSLVPCNEDEYRSPETNRCRKFASASNSLVPCSEGQERNPETNRCRNVGSVAAADIATEVLDLQPQNTPGSINWGIIGAAIAATLAYMAYEWRFEIFRAVARLKNQYSSR